MLTAEDQMAIEQQLGDFLKKSEAQWSALVDKGGNLFAQFGDTGNLDLSILSALAAGSFAATHELAKRLGESEFSALYHEGHGHHILMSALHHECLLVTIFGEKTNIGAGTVTCNYDGKDKHQTIIEDEVRIGSDTMLVAPVRVGRGAVTAAGSVVTEDVPPNTLVAGVPAVIKKKLKRSDE